MQELSTQQFAPLSVSQGYWGSLQPVNWGPAPAQQAFGVFVSPVSGPMQAQLPAVHMPDLHALSSLHAAPLA